MSRLRGSTRARIEMRALLKELRTMGKTILVSSHILPELADICNKIGIIEQGCLLVNGEVSEVMKQVRTDIVLNIAVAERLTDAVEHARNPARGRERSREERRSGRQAQRGHQPVQLPGGPADRAGLRAHTLQGRRDQPRDRFHAPDQGDHELTHWALALLSSRGWEEPKAAGLSFFPLHGLCSGLRCGMMR